MKKFSKTNDQITNKLKFSFFPGCSLKASGNENTLSLLKFFEQVNIKLVELEDWSCCGSSSAHSVNRKISELLALRNIFLASKDMPLLIACPSCLLRTKTTYNSVKKEKAKKKEYEQYWGKKFNDELEIIHFFEIFDKIHFEDYKDKFEGKLKNLKVASYYGCMLSMPPSLRFEKKYTGIMEKTLSNLGAKNIYFGYSTKCCGTYLSVAKPLIVQKVANKIMSEAINAGAECLVTACSMCHLNLEIRCTLKNKIPVFHFSELISMALGAEDRKKWFPRHIIDPLPLLKKYELIE